MLQKSNKCDFGNSNSNSTKSKFFLITQNPKWLIDKFGGNGQDSTILVFDEKLHPRRFGSRRHYSFSSSDYREASKKIVTLMAQRYGNHPSVV
jgi:beta-galactosidase GanA